MNIRNNIETTRVVNSKINLSILNTFKISKILDFSKIINPEISIHRDHLIETSFSVYFL